MKKDSLQKLIAEHGYNVGFGAKKHFATFDIINKSPTLLSILVLIIGIIKVAYENFEYQKEASIFLIVIGVIGIFLSQFRLAKNEYEQAGIKLTQHFNALKELYFRVKDNQKTDYSAENQELKNIMENYYNDSISNQIIGSDLYAHIKFYMQMQIGWIEDELSLKLFKDKIPSSIKVLSFIILIVAIFLIIKQFILPLI